MIKHCTQLFQRALPQRWLRILLKSQSDYRLPTLTLSRLCLCVFMWWSLRAEILNKYLILLSFLSLLELSGTDSSFGIGMMPRNPFHCEFQPNNELCLKNSLVNDNHQLCINILSLFFPAAVDVRGQVRSLVHVSASCLRGHHKCLTHIAIQKFGVTCHKSFIWDCQMAERIALYFYLSCI